MYVGFFDESGTLEAGGYICLAGFVIAEEKLPAFDDAWNAALARHGVPVRIGIGKGTFYDVEYTTTTPAAAARVVSTSRFYGTAVIHAHAAEQCGGKGMRIFLHQSLDEDLALIRDNLRPMKLRRPLKGVNYEIDYLHEATAAGHKPSADEKDRALFGKVALLKNPAWPRKVLRQYTETFAALNRMRKANGRKGVAAHRQPSNAPHGTIW
jgi:hypothetical protein